MWEQNYNPLHSQFWSTVEAALPVVILLSYIASNIFRPHHAALVALLIANIIAAMIFEMPVSIGILASGYGMVSGFVTVGWTVLNVFFLYRLTVMSGRFDLLQRLVGRITKDCRIQLLLIAFAFGSFFEGSTAFGTPVAITGAILIGLGFKPLAAAVLSLIANTTAVGYAAFGVPELALQTSMGVDPQLMGAMVGRQVSVFSVLIPFWLIYVFAGWRGMWEVWPAILVTGLSFGVTQFVVSNYFSFTLVSIIASLVAMASLLLWLSFWQPKKIWRATAMRHHNPYEADPSASEGESARDNSIRFKEVWGALMPWVMMCVTLVLWNADWFKQLLNGATAIQFAVPGLDKAVVKMPPAVPVPTPESVVFNFTWLTYPGTAILLAALVIGLSTGVGWSSLSKSYLGNLKHIQASLFTIMIMFAIGTVTRFAGIDTTLGLAFVDSGVLYPFFGTMLGWLGVASTGTVTGSNLLLGNIQKVTAEQLNLSPYLMGAAHTSGGVFGKMVGAQSIVIASTVTGSNDQAGTILRFIFIHAVLLGALMGLWVLMQAYLMPWMIVDAP